MSHGEPVLWSLYIYAPNKQAPIFFTSAYGLLTLGHIWQCYHHKSWRLIGLHPLCGILLTFGYALRIYSANDNYIYIEEQKAQILIPFILSQVFIYVSPPLLELANYHILGRIFYYVPHHTPLPPDRVLFTFGGIMLLIELINGLGASLAANPSSGSTQQSLGSNLIIAAVSLQVAVILIFFVLAGIFHYRTFKAGVTPRAVIVPLRTLYVSMVLIFIRCIYRTVEHSGHSVKDINEIEVLRQLTPILRYEWFFYVFEASLILVNSVLWNIWSPGRFLPQSHSVFLGKDGVETYVEEGVDTRSTRQKWLAVLSIGVLYRRKRGFQVLAEAERGSVEMGSVEGRG
ncbi:hypothetical protein BJY04DRAFT_214120 [Aspergillus karnatakaensis]|uniref:putative RTA1 domain protein n=1 Tax=Aspergillus karnatakaensis TaxID=1810916 RepID=UPI003CCD0212